MGCESLSEPSCKLNMARCSFDDFFRICRYTKKMNKIFLFIPLILILIISFFLYHLGTIFTPSEVSIWPRNPSRKIWHEISYLLVPVSCLCMSLSSRSWVSPMGNWTSTLRLSTTESYQLSCLFETVRLSWRAFRIPWRAVWFFYRSVRISSKLLKYFTFNSKAKKKQQKNKTKNHQKYIFFIYILCTYKTHVLKVFLNFKFPKILVDWCYNM